MSIKSSSLQTLFLKCFTLRRTSTSQSQRMLNISQVLLWATVTHENFYHYFHLLSFQVQEIFYFPKDGSLLNVLDCITPLVIFQYLEYSSKSYFSMTCLASAYEAPQYGLSPSKAYVVPLFASISAFSLTSVFSCPVNQIRCTQFLPDTSRRSCRQLEINLDVNCSY